MPVVQIDKTLKLEDYRGIGLPAQLDQAQRLAIGLKGLRVMNVNSTADGGGVAEILRSMVPLMRDVGIDAQWMVIPGNEAFFEITKKLHNLMQGGQGELTAAEVSTYVAQSWDVSKEIAFLMLNQGRITRPISPSHFIWPIQQEFSKMRALMSFL